MSYLQNQAFSSVTPEWCTPKEIIEAARRAMRRIETDPASNPGAQEWIKADVFYTKETNGLHREWYGRVWLNPPFNQSEEWVNKLLEEYEAGRVEEAILLCKFVPNYNWFRPLIGRNMIVADRRISFLKPDGSKGSSKLDTPVCFIYLGSYPEAFFSEFSQFGYVTFMGRAA